MKVHTDCRYFRGEKPCRFKRLCEGCHHYDPMGTRILLVKLGAMGDVMRTTPLVEALRRRHDPCHLTWVVAPDSEELLVGIEGIDRVVPLDVEASIALPAQEFDLVICLDKEPAATGLATRVPSAEKRGFLMDRYGSLVPAGPEAEYAYRLGLDDTLKYFENQKTYQEIIFEACGLEFSGEDYQLPLGEGARTAAAERLEGVGIAVGERLVGFNVGAGDAFAYKAWRVEGFAELARRVSSELGARVLLLGGPRERERAAAICADAGDAIVDPGATASLQEFAAIVERCEAVVTGDTLAMHIALATQRKVVVIFGSTCAQEIEMYGRGEKIVPRVDCHPCYRAVCDLSPTCADSVSADQVFASLRGLWERAG